MGNKKNIKKSPRKKKKVLRNSPRRLITIVFFVSFLASTLASYNYKKVNSQPTDKPQDTSAYQLANEAKNKCSNERNITKCYAKEMENLAFTHGEKIASNALFEIQKIDSRAKACHFIAHGIGWGSFKRDPDNWQELIAGSSPMCSYGAQMGIIEMYVQNLPDGKLQKEDVENLCGKKPQADCNHAVGHMMLLEAENNFDKALDLCDGIGSEEQNFMCLHGVFMERFIGSNLIEHGLLPKSMGNWPERLPQNEDFCRTFSGKLADACWREIVHPAYFYFGKDAKQIFDFCNTAPEESMQQICKKHAIPEIAGGKGHDLISLKSMCQLQHDVDPLFEEFCYNTLISLKINSVEIKDGLDTIEFCESMNETYKKSCFENIKRGLDYNQIKGSEMNLYCDRFPAEHKKICSRPSAS